MEIDKQIEIQDIKKVWLVWTCTDLTEGRGSQYVLYACETEATAMRLAKGKYVMGSNCPISESFAIKIKNSWYAQCRIEQPSSDDKIKQDKINASRIAVSRAKELGLTDEDIKLIIRGEA